MKALAYHAYDDTRTGFIRALAYIDISLVALESRKLRQSPKLTAYRIHMDEQHWTHLGKNSPLQAQRVSSWGDIKAENSRFEKCKISKHLMCKAYCHLAPSFNRCLHNCLRYSGGGSSSH